MSCRCASTEGMTNLMPYVQQIRAVQTEGWNAFLQAIESFVSERYVTTASTKQTS